ncbi:MAG: RecX family transcriptional regulator [Alphaproteobacteria bacterium]|nr:RecX family transcriptional regulator [Alphaproteobacteria bacterium]
MAMPARPVFKRAPKTPTPAYLHNAALHYLGRYAASRAGLKKILMNKLRRAAMRDPAFAADKTLIASLEREIDALIEKFAAQGILNDTAFAEMKVAGLRRAGASARAIKQKLQLKGIDRDTGAAALLAHDEDGDTAGGEEAELAAAMRYARRRKLGPYRAGAPAPEQMRERQRKDIATLARAGFSLDIAKQIVGGDKDPGALDHALI